MRLIIADTVAHQMSYALLTDTPFRDCLTTMTVRTGASASNGPIRTVYAVVEFSNANKQGGTMKGTIQQFQALTTVSLFGPLAPASWDTIHQATFDPADIRQPWRRSSHGFPALVAQLAAKQNLILHCREDEIFEVMAATNDLLSSPAALNQAYTWLYQLQQETLEKLARLRQVEEQLLTQAEIPELMAYAEHLLTEPASSTVVDRLESQLSPDQPSAQVTGLNQMVRRFQVWLPALEEVKNQGFRVIVLDRSRQPDRPALEARRYEAIGQDKRPDGLMAGFLLPKRYHLTLWAYLVGRSDIGQAAVWN